MTRLSGGRVLARGLRIAAAAAALCMLTTGVAQAATVSQATASAIQITALSTPLVPKSAAANDGSVPKVVDTVAETIPVIPGTFVVNTGIYDQTAIARNDGSSAACAGIAGSGGALTIGDDGSCSATTAGPALINLPGFTLAGTGFAFRLEASTLYSYCTAGPGDGTDGFSAGSTLANVTLVARATVLGIQGPEIRIPINANGSFSIPQPFASVISLDVNQVDTTGPKTSATALHIGIGPNSSILGLDLGKTTCGDNAATADVPMMPMTPQGLAVSLGTLAVIGGSVYTGRTLRRSRMAA